MANAILNRKRFEREIGKLDEKLQNKIAMFGTPIDKMNEQELEIEVSPNRPDLLSYHGFKRAFLAFLNKETGLKKYKINKPEKDYKVIIDSSVKDIRPYTACAIVKGLKFDDEKIKEIIDMQEKLHFTLGRKRKKIAIGIYPLEKIKLPITFKALEPDKIKFIPLEEEKEMSGFQILQKHPTGKEYAHLLSGKQKFPIFIDAENNILSMPPIINSNSTGKVTEKTTEVFIECSGFDFENLSRCLNIVVANFADMGGKIYEMELDYKDKKITPNFSTDKTKLSLSNVNSRLGLELNEKEIKKLLERMGHDYSKGVVESPGWRVDILHQVDLIKDIAIAYGYENFVPKIPEVSTIGGVDKKQIIIKNIAEMLVGLNILEVSNYHLTNKQDQFKNMAIPEENFLEVEQSKTEYTILRKNLTHYLLKNLSENVDAEYPQKIFEIGKVFNNKEKENLAIAFSPSNFTEIRQILEYMFRMLDIPIEISECKKYPNYFIDGRTIQIKINNKEVGFLGEIHPKILKNWKIKMPVSLFEIELEEIFEKFK
jgi:phenylalanyl-tRNA synthetase beta chain